MTSFKRFWRNNLNLTIMFLVAVAIQGLFYHLVGYDRAIFYYQVLVTFVAYVGILVLARLQSRRKAREFQNVIEAGGALKSNFERSLSDTEYMMLNVMQEEEELLQNLRAELLEQREEQQDYYAVWLHQIKTPLSVLRLRLQSPQGLDPELGLQKLMEIERYADLALVFANLADDKKALNLTRVDVKDLLLKILERYRVYEKGQRVNLETELTETPVVSDPLWLALAIEQFVMNANKFAPEGHVTLTLRDYRLTIADDGCGVHPNDLPRIFDRGYAGSPDNLRRESSGLGLYLAKRILTKLKIPFTFASEYGEGTTVTLTFEPPEERLFD